MALNSLSLRIEKLARFIGPCDAAKLPFAIFTTAGYQRRQSCKVLWFQAVSGSAFHVSSSNVFIFM